MNIIPIFFIGFSVCWYALQALSLFRMSSSSRLQRLLSYIFIWWGLSTLKDLLLYLPDTDVREILRHIYFIDGFGAVSFAFVLLELTMPGWLTLKRVTALFLPFLGFFIAHFFVDSEWLIQLFTLFFVVFAWVSFLVGLCKGREYARAIRENYSNLEDVDISWVWGILAAFFICQHVWWAVADTLDAVADSFYYLASLFCWHFTLRGVNRLRPLRLPAAPSDNASATGSLAFGDGAATDSDASSPAMLAKRRTTALATRLEQLVEKERPYLNPDLTMADLSLLVGTNRTYLSNYLSAELGTTFYDYVNRLRIERSVLPLMQSDAPLSLEHIATRSGFKSMSTFRRAFLKFTGQLPSDYMRH